MSDKCFLRGCGPCNKKISREHYLSRSILEQLSSDGSAQTAGLPWQPPKQYQKFGIEALTAKILCDRHNSRLAPLDKVAGKLFRALHAADKDFSSMPLLSRFNGPYVERWLLKVLCGLEVMKKKCPPPLEWREILVGGPWPTGWGLYLSQGGDTPIILGGGLMVETFCDASGQVRAATLGLAGLHIRILLKDPTGTEGMYRPRGIVVQRPEGEKRIELVWPHAPETALVLRRVGLNLPRQNGRQEAIL